LAQITIGYSTASSTLTASPSPLYVPQTAGATSITWSAGSGVSSISGVSISMKNGVAFGGTQPAQAGNSNVWTWVDPETSTSTYEYVVSANVDNLGVRTLDPQIINTTRPPG